MEKVILGMSGGIDSAVSAAVLKNMGYEVLGCHFLLSEKSSADSVDANNARRTAEILGIDFIIADYKQRFKERVTDYFIKEYLVGRTPNPCLVCNPNVKFACLAELAEKYGAQKISTGHYALIEDSSIYGGKVIRASDSLKDQSYFLSALTPELIEKIIFPLGSFKDKSEVRNYGKKLSLPNFSKPDSQEICFIPDNDYAKYIVSHSSYEPKCGNFLDNDGNIIGKHTGIINYTVGQRKGLGAFGQPMYVKNINPAENTVTLCKKEERFSSFIKTENISWAVKNHPENDFYGDVKIRSTAKAVRAHIKIADGRFSADFEDNRVLAPCPGQTAVIYKDGIVLGGGIICSGL